MPRPPCRCRVTYNPGDLTAAAPTAADPNPVVAELEPVGPPPKPDRKPERSRRPPRLPQVALPQSERPARALIPPVRGGDCECVATCLHCMPEDAGVDASPTCAKTAVGE